MENPRGGFSGVFKGGNYKQYRPSYPQGKGKQPMVGQDRPRCRFSGKHPNGPCNIQCYGCGELGYKMNVCPKAAWNQPRALPATHQQRPPNSAPQGRPSVPGAAQQPRNPRKQQVGG